MNNYRKLSIEEVKKIELQILGFIDQICIKNNLTYFLAWGTLLGAVRHKGFIPWDDDIDLLMPRKDYELLPKLIQEADTSYKYLSFNTDKEYHYPFAKVVDKSTLVIEKNTLNPHNMGVWVDIFPLDYLPDNEVQSKKIQSKCWNYRQIWGHAIVWELNKKNRGIVYSIACRLCYLYGWRKALYNLHDLAKSSLEQTKFVSELIDCESKYNKMPSSWFSSYVKLEFEGNLYCAPIGYKDYLESCYGNFMKLPPIDQRVPKHDFVAYKSIKMQQ